MYERFGTVIAVSVIIPCRNERSTIERCIESIVDDSFDQESWEILVIDGDSDDGTNEVLQTICDRYTCVRVIRNPRQLKPVALNIGIRESRGSIVVRVDAHTTYPPAYVRRVATGLREHGAQNYGGIQVPVADSGGVLALSIAATNYHPLAVGDAVRRSSERPVVRSVSTVYCGCFERSLFDEIGMFNEALVRTQDRELNRRIIAHGGTILLDTSIRCEYRPRSSLAAHLKWTADGAFWLFQANRFTDIPMIDLRNLAPMALAFALLCLFLLGIADLLVDSPPLDVLFALAAIAVLAYLSVALTVGVQLALKFRRAALIVVFPLVLFLTHMSYASASIIGYLNRFRGSGP